MFIFCNETLPHFGQKKAFEGTAVLHLEFVHITSATPAAIKGTEELDRQDILLVDVITTKRWCLWTAFKRDLFADTAELVWLSQIEAVPFLPPSVDG